MSCVELTDTQQALLDFVRTQTRSITAPEAADELGIPRTTARENLQCLADNSIIDTAKSARTRLYYTPTTWGEHQLLSDRDKEFLTSGAETRTEKRQALNRILLGLKDYPREIPLGDGPRRGDVELIAEYVELEKPIEEVTYLELTGCIMREIPEETKWDGMMEELNTPNRNVIRSVRRRLHIRQDELAEYLANELGDKTEQTYTGYISKFENGKDTPLTETAIKAIGEYLQEKCEENTTHSPRN